MTRLILCLLLPAVLGAGDLSAQSRSDVLGEASRLRRSGDGDAARRLLASFVAEHPDDAMAALYYGDLVASTGDSEGAMTIWRALLDRVPPDAGHYVNAARRARRLGLADMAISWLEEGVQQTGSDAPFVWDLGQLYLETGRYEEAAACHVAMVRGQPYQVQQLQSQLDGVAAQDRQDGVEPRLIDYSRALAATLSDEGEAAHLLLAHALLLTDRADEGLAVARMFVTARPAAPRDAVAGALGRFAETAETTGQIDAATAAYSLLTEWTGDGAWRAVAPERRSAMQERQGDLDRAIALRRQLVAGAGAGPDAPGHKLALARLLLRADDAAGARPLLDELARAGDLSGDQRVESQRLLIESLWRLDELDALPQELAYLRQLPGGEPPARLDLVQLAALAGDTEAATAHADSVATVYPSSDEANDALLWLALLEDHIMSPDAISRFAAARLLQRQGREGEADATRTALAADGHTALAHRLALEAAEKRHTASPAAALLLYDGLTADSTATPQIRYAATLAAARLRAASGDRAVPIRQLEQLLLALPEDARAPIALEQLQRLQAETEQMP